MSIRATAPLTPLLFAMTLLLGVPACGDISSYSGDEESSSTDGGEDELDTPKDNPDDDVPDLSAAPSTSQEDSGAFFDDKGTALASKPASICDFGLSPVFVSTPQCTGYNDYLIPLCDKVSPADPGARAHWQFYGSDNIWNIGWWNINTLISLYNQPVGICHAKQYPLRCDQPLVLKYGAWGGVNSCPWTEERKLFEAPQAALDPSFTLSVSTSGSSLASVTVTGAPNQCDTWHQFNLINVATGQVVETIAWWQVNANRYEEGPFTFSTLVPMGPGADQYRVQRGVWNACTYWTASTKTVAVAKHADTK